MIKVKLYLLVTLIILNATLIYFVLSIKIYPSITFLNVGQGDAILIKDNFLNEVLVDAGPGSLIIQELKKQIPFFDKKIELVIITHPEKDHFAGLFYLIKNFKIEKVLLNGAVKNTKEFKDLILALKANNVKLATIEKDTFINLAGINIKTLWPLNDLVGINLVNSNNSGVVNLVESDNNKILLLADVENTVEKFLSDNYSSYIQNSIVKISHHGSKTGSSIEFLQKFSPKEAVISVGKNNPYKHPAQIVLDHLKTLNIKTLRTDLMGSVNLILD